MQDACSLPNKHIFYPFPIWVWPKAGLTTISISTKDAKQLRCVLTQIAYRCCITSLLLFLCLLFHLLCLFLSLCSEKKKEFSHNYILNSTFLYADRAKSTFKWNFDFKTYTNDECKCKCKCKCHHHYHQHGLLCMQLNQIQKKLVPDSVVCKSSTQIAYIFFTLILLHAISFIFLFGHSDCLCHRSNSFSFRPFYSALSLNFNGNFIIQRNAAKNEYERGQNGRARHISRITLEPSIFYHFTLESLVPFCLIWFILNIFKYVATHFAIIETLLLRRCRRVNPINKQAQIWMKKYSTGKNVSCSGIVSFCAPKDSRWACMHASLWSGQCVCVKYESAFILHRPNKL